MAKYQSFEWENVEPKDRATYAALLDAIQWPEVTIASRGYSSDTKLLDLQLGMNADIDLTSRVVSLCDAAKLARPTSKIDSGCGINLRSAEDVRLATPTADKRVEVKTPVEPKVEPVKPVEAAAAPKEIAAMEIDTPKPAVSWYTKILNFFKRIF